MEISSKIQFADEKIKEAFLKLNESITEEKELFSFLERAFCDIEKNAFCGIQIPKKQIPREYLKKYGVHNLWKYNLPNAWRLIYSIERDKVVVISIILEWMDHKSYERRFKC